MKKYIFIIALLANALSLFAQKETFKLATYNLRYDNAKDIGNLWVNRVNIMAELIEDHQFDIFCTQEAKANQIKDLVTKMPQYSWTGIDKAGDGTDEYCAIFYKEKRFKLIEKGHFWLSETPEVVSKGWDAKYRRVCSWANLEDLKTGARFYVFDAHFDHKGMIAQENSANLILQKIQEIAKDKAVILCGDFNFDRTSPHYTVLSSAPFIKDAHTVAKARKSSTGSYNGFDINSSPESPIDHLFVTSNVAVNRYEIITDSFKGKLPSDHYPVMIEAQVLKNQPALTNKTKAKK